MESARRSGALLRVPFMVDRGQRLRSLSSRRTVALVVALALLVFGLAGIASGQAVDCTKPTIQHVTVNQGIDSRDPTNPSSVGYSPLAWGKDMIVRPYLTASCSTSPKMETTGGVLHVKLGALPLTSPTGIGPYDAIGSDPPDIAACCTPQNNSAADPKFLVSGSVLSFPSGVGGSEALTFSVTVNYKTSAGTGTVSKDITRVVGKQTNPLRVLIVPMGDNSSSVTQFTTGDNTAVQNAMGALSRMMPVANGVGGLSAASTVTDGVRWDIAPGLLDLGPAGLNVMTAGQKFCGNTSNFDKIKLELTKSLHAWNSSPQNAGKPADRVVGVVGESISTGSATNSACYDGQAAAPGVQAWVRAVSSTTPSTTGAFMGMEVEHTFGIVPPNDPRNIGFHSINTVAETANRAYNLTTRDWLSADRSVMTNSGVWNNNTTLLEAPDWSWTMCMLGGSATGCAVPWKIGAPAAQGSSFRISGTTDGFKAGTRLISNRTTGGARSEEDATSNFFLVYRGGTKQSPGATLEGGTFRLPVSFAQSEHHHSPPSGPVTGSVDATFPFDPAATLIQVWKGRLPGASETCASADACIYETEQTAVPEALGIEVTPTEWTFRRFTNTAANEIQPNISFDGRFLTYVERTGGGDPCGKIIVTELEPLLGQAPRTAEIDGCFPPADLANTRGLPEDPAMAPDSRAIAFVRNGDLFRIAFDPEGVQFIGREAKVYSCARETVGPLVGKCVTGATLGPLQGAAAGPAWAPEARAQLDQWLVFEVTGDLYKLFPFRVVDVLGQRVGVTDAQRLTETRNNFQPTVAPAKDGTQLVAFVRDKEASEAIFSPALYTLDTENLTEPAKQRLECCGRLPSWGGELIAYEPTTSTGEGTGNIAILNPDSGLSELITNTGGDTSPSLTASFGKTMAIERHVDGGAGDIYLGETTTRQDITLLGRDVDNPADTRGFIYVECGGGDAPVKVDVEPSFPDPLDGTIVAFTADNHDPALDCAAAPAVGIISDGYSLSNRLSGGPVVASPKSPVATIISPLQKARVGMDSRVPLAGAAWDAEGRVLGGNKLSWAIKLPGSSTWVDVGTGATKDVAPSDVAGPAATQWPVGRYSARLTADDGQTRSETTVDFIVLRQAAINFDPDTVHVPSSGDPEITVYVSLLPAELRLVTQAQITHVDGQPLQTPLLSQWWRVDSKSGLGVARFSKGSLTQVLQSFGVFQGRALITIEGCSTACDGPGDVFTGADPNHPVLKRS